MRINKMMFLKPYKKEAGWEKIYDNFTGDNDFYYRYYGKYINNKFISTFGHSSGGSDYNQYGISISGNGDTWINTDLQYNHPTYGQIHPYFIDFAYGNNKYVAVTGIKQSDVGLSAFINGGNFGQINTSSDGVTWSITKPIFDTNFYYRGVAFGNNKFIAVGYHGDHASSIPGSIVSVSIDGLSWVNLTTTNIDILDTCQILNINYFNNKFVITGYENDNLGFLSNNFSYTSIDGVTWIRNTNSVLPQDYILENCNSKLVSIIFVPGSSNITGDMIITTSTDGVNWTTNTVTNNFQNYSYGASIRKIIFSGSLYLATDGWKIYTSPDLQNWTQQNVEVYSYNDVITNGNKFIINAGTVNNRSFNLESTDAVQWKYKDSLFYSANYETSGGYFGQENVCIKTYPHSKTYNSYGIDYTVDNGYSWYAYKYAVLAQSDFNDETYFYTGSYGSYQQTGLYKKNSLLGWQLIQADPNAPAYVNFRSLAVNANHVVLQDDSNIRHLNISSGVWTNVTTLPTGTYTNLVWTGTVFSTFNRTASLVYTSSDGLTWTSQTANFLNTNTEIVYDGTKFLTLEANASFDVELSTSIDGSVWSTAHTFSTGGFYLSFQPKIVYVDNKYFVYIKTSYYSNSGNDFLFVSSDANNWTNISSKINNYPDPFYLVVFNSTFLIGKNSLDNSTYRLSI